MTNYPKNIKRSDTSKIMVVLQNILPTYIIQKDKHYNTNNYEAFPPQSMQNTLSIDVIPQLNTLTIAIYTAPYNFDKLPLDILYNNPNIIIYNVNNDNTLMGVIPIMSDLADNIII